MQPMVILGRDGVINQSQASGISSVDEWTPISGSLEAIVRLKKAGVAVTVATNQPAVGLGKLDQETLSKIHQKMEHLLQQRGIELDGIYVCPHRPNDNCICRKPKPGLLLQIAKAHDIALADAIMVGDKFSDIQAARMAGAKVALVRTGRGLRTLDKHGPLDDVPQYQDLAHFVREFLKSLRQ